MGKSRNKQAKNPKNIQWGNQDGNKLKILTEKLLNVAALSQFMLFQFLLLTTVLHL